MKNIFYTCLLWSDFIIWTNKRGVVSGWTVRHKTLIFHFYSLKNSSATFNVHCQTYITVSDSRECRFAREANANVKNNFIVKSYTERAEWRCQILTRQNATLTESVDLLPFLSTLQEWMSSTKILNSYCSLTCVAKHSGMISGCKDDNCF